MRHEEQQGQGLFVLKCGFGLPVWRVLPAWVRLLFVRFAGGAVRLAACAFCWPKKKQRCGEGLGLLLHASVVRHGAGGGGGGMG